MAQGTKFEIRNSSLKVKTSAYYSPRSEAVDTGRIVGVTTLEILTSSLIKGMGRVCINVKCLDNMKTNV